MNHVCRARIHFDRCLFVVAAFVFSRFAVSHFRAVFVPFLCRFRGYSRFRAAFGEDAVDNTHTHGLYKPSAIFRARLRLELQPRGRVVLLPRGAWGRFRLFPSGLGPAAGAGPRGVPLLGLRRLRGGAVSLRRPAVRGWALSLLRPRGPQPRVASPVSLSASGPAGFGEKRAMAVEQRVQLGEGWENHTACIWWHLVAPGGIWHLVGGGLRVLSAGAEFVLAALPCLPTKASLSPSCSATAVAGRSSAPFTSFPSGAYLS